MKVKLLVSRSGVGFSQNVGDVIDVDKSEGLALIKAGQAVAQTTKETASTKKTSTKATK